MERRERVPRGVVVLLVVLLAIGLMVGLVFLGGWIERRSIAAAERVVMPTPSPTAKSIVTLAPTATPVPKTPTATPVAAETVAYAAESAEAAHRARLEGLDPMFRSSGFDAWLKEAGFSWNTITYRTDQVIEETWKERQWASGIPVSVVGLNAPWPNALTTDEAVSQGRCIEAGPESKLCTDVTGFDGRATLYVDVQNWSQLNPDP